MREAGGNINRREHKPLRCERACMIAKMYPVPLCKHDLSNYRVIRSNVCLRNIGILNGNASVRNVGRANFHVVS